MEMLAAELRERVATMASQLHAMPEEEVARKPAPDKWSKKEILGHLIDSACNNHQRFVRAQLEPELVAPAYEQDGWVRAQGYGMGEWHRLVEFWSFYNQHLADVIARFPADKLATPCRIGSYPVMTLADLAEDYVRHLDHHLGQLLRGSI